MIEHNDTNGNEQKIITFNNYVLDKIDNLEDSVFYFLIFVTFFKKLKVDYKIKACVNVILFKFFGLDCLKNSKYETKILDLVLN